MCRDYAEAATVLRNFLKMHVSASVAKIITKDRAFITGLTPYRIEE